MSEPALDEAYWDELLVVLAETLLVIPFAQLFILQQMLTDKTTLVQGVSQRLAVSRLEVSRSSKIETTC